MQQLKYIQGYPAHLVDQVQQLIDKDQLKTLLLSRYPTPHTIKTEKALYDYVIELKNQYLKKSAPISKVGYDNKINVINHALGLHTFVSRVHGNKLKAKHEIRIAAVFKDAPLPFLRMIVVHELATLTD
ncbi:M48 family metallopeptidase [Photobacterium carnosum]|uniref:Metal-dependent hydrolase n=1 Tax=Photobacterium carnosum TaxID=2023717 RepID=A0A2N4ULU4_9GAMM|nr:M48 family metallopeptidase [Photobacterium carnosum]PLC55985.1 hypothetical protein CIK00_20825 [Photobacterium carnosum]